MDGKMDGEWMGRWMEGEFSHSMFSFLVTSPQETGGSMSQDSGGALG